MSTEVLEPPVIAKPKGKKPPVADEPAPEYVMPAIRQGDWVAFRLQPTEPTSAPALVQDVGDRAVTLLVFYRGNLYGEQYDGVHHIGDPVLPMVDQWVWDYSDSYKKLQADMDELRDFVTANHK